MKEITSPTRSISPEEAIRNYGTCIIAGDTGSTVYLLNRQRRIIDREYSFVSLDGLSGAVGVQNSATELIAHFLSLPGSRVFVFEDDKEFGEWLSKR